MKIAPRFINKQETIFSIFSIFLVDNLCWTVFIPIFPAFFRPQYGFLSVGLLFAMKPLTQFLTTSLAMAAVDNLGMRGANASFCGV
jgi:hypothetical protein